MAGGMLKENELLSDNKGEGSQIYFLSQASFRANEFFCLGLVVVLDNLRATTTSTSMKRLWHIPSGVGNVESSCKPTPDPRF